MIEIKNISKRFGKTKALKNLDMHIDNGGIFGIVGSNGAGKSTLMRLLVGVYHADEGQIIIDGDDAFDNPDVKKKCVFLSDTSYFNFGANLESMAKEYAKHYLTFSFEEYENLVELFGLNPTTSLISYSKGMQKQALIILALACKCQYTILDETLDGLDPVMRGVVKKRLYQSVIDDDSTIIITSHSLRELDDTCDNLAMLHDGKIIYQKDIQDIKTSLIKVQVAFSEAFDIKTFSEIDVLKYTKNGSVANLVVKGDKLAVSEILKAMNPMLLEIVPLSLEEIFTYELKERGYAFDDVFNKEDDDEQS